jgi:O-antigen/teichoic acid export membrane protein
MRGTAGAIEPANSSVLPESPGREPRRNNVTTVLMVAGGNAASAGLAIIANWLVANRLGPSEFGLFSLAIGVMTLLQEIGGSALDTAIVRYAALHARADPLRAEIYFKAGFGLKLLIGGGLGAAFAIAAGGLADRVYAVPALRPLFYWMAAGLLAANLSTFVLARLQAAERFFSYSILRALGNALKVGLLGAAAAVGLLDLQATAAIWSLSFLLAYAISLPFARAPRGTLPRQPDDSPYRDIMRFAKWVMLSSLFFAIHMRADVLLLGRYRPSEDVGYYAIAWNMMLFIDLLTSSIAAALLPQAAKVTNRREALEFRRTLLMASIIIALSLSPIYLFAGPIIATLFPGYQLSIAPFRVLFWSSVIALLIYPLHLSFYAENKPAKVSAINGVLAMTSVIVGFLIIPSGGLLGTAKTTLIARALGGAVLLALLFAARVGSRPANSHG